MKNCIFFSHLLITMCNASTLLPVAMLCISTAAHIDRMLNESASSLGGVCEVGLTVIQLI